MRTLDFDDLHFFVRLAALGTLSALARERDVPVSQVSRALTRIEKACGVPLVHRSTHGLAFTGEGDTFLAYCHRLCGTLDTLQSEFADHAREVRGTVRLATSPAMAHYLLIPSLAGLAARHPALEIDLIADDRMADMVRDGIDLALRSGSTHTDAVVARTLGHHGRGLYASPTYVARHGMPATPDALASHRLIVNSMAPQLNRWPFVVGGEGIELAVHGHWRATSTGLMMTMVLAGLGICRCNTLIAAPMVAEGRLVPVLADVVAPRQFPIYAVVLPQRQRLPKIQACIDYFAEFFAAIPAIAAVPPIAATPR